jgi:NAD(P)-dependent dehydrogenase (short-subunit alcohol dehydrogenase family)
MSIVFITGSGRKGGIGFETAKQLGMMGNQVIISGRKPERADALLKELHDDGIEASFAAIDLTDDSSVSNAAAEVEKQFGKIDILINDAALMQAGASVEEQDLDELRRVFNTNVIGTWSVTQKFLPLLKKSEHPRIVNVSSGAGSFEDPKYGLLHGTIVQMPMGYGISKLALNGLTVKMAKEFAPYHILVNSVCPDTTDSFGSGMWGRPVEISAKSVIWAALLPDDGPTGGFFRDGNKLPW